MKASNTQSSFLKKQLREEKALNNKLSLNDKSKVKLQAHHSMHAIYTFFENHSKTIAKQHYLYEVPTSLPSAQSATFQPNWCDTEKRIYPLDGHNYCLFSRSEYKAAIANNVSKAIFTDIKPQKVSSKSESKKSSFSKKHQKKSKSSSKNSNTVPIFVTIEDDDEYAFIDVLGDDECGPIGDFRPVYSLPDQVTEIVVEEEQITVSPQVDTPQEEKLIPIIPPSTHIENILNYDGVCQEEEEEVIVESTALIIHSKSEKTKENRIKRQRTERDDDEVDNLRDQIERLNEHNKLESELRELEQQLVRQRLQILERRFANMTQAMSDKDLEIQSLKRHIKQQGQKQQQPTVGDYFTPVNNVSTPKKKRVVAPRTKKPAKEQQPSLELFMVPYNNNNNNQSMEMIPLLQPVAVAAVIDETLSAEFIERSRQFAEQYAREDAYAVEMLVPCVEYGVINIGVTFTYAYKLSDYLEKFLAATNDRTRNGHVRDLLDHPFMQDYKVNLLTNMTVHAPTTNNAQLVANMMHQKSQVLNPRALEVRLNLSAINIHTWFIAKAIHFEQLALNNPKQMKSTPIILKNFAYSYHADILQKWYPYLDAGNGHIIMHDLAIPAISVDHGRGCGKNCHFCGQSFIAESEGKLKFSHQVIKCDFIANMSNDERVILAAVLEKRRTNEAFADHLFVKEYETTSLLRLATEREIANGLYLTYYKEGDKKNGDRVRINMPVLLGMRETVYTRFLMRIDALDKHDLNTTEKVRNLNAKPIAHQLDCFEITTAQPALGQQQQQKSTKKTVRAGTIKKSDGFLYKTLLDYEGNHFRTSKFTPDGKQMLRDFTYNPETGFGDDMYFSSPLEPLPTTYPVVSAIPFPPTIEQQVNMFYGLHQQQQQLQLEQEQQLLTNFEEELEAEEAMSVDEPVAIHEMPVLNEEKRAPYVPKGRMTEIVNEQEQPFRFFNEFDNNSHFYSSQETLSFGGEFSSSFNNDLYSTNEPFIFDEAPLKNRFSLHDNSFNDDHF